MVEISREKIKALFVVITLVMSSLTYVSQDSKLLGYALTVLVLFFTSYLLKIKFDGRYKIIPIIYLFFVFVSIASNLNNFSEFPLQSFLYPVIFFISYSCLWVIYKSELRGVDSIKYYFLFIAFVAVLPLFDIKSIPFFGDINTGRYIFFTSLPSSSSIYWNVNYYAASQAAGFWLVLCLLSSRKISNFNLVILLIIGLSVIVGSSRGITVSFLFSIFLYKILSLDIRRRFFLFVFSFVLIAVFWDYFNAFQLSEETEIALRLDRGLNSRDQLWIVAIEVMKISPFFGHASPELAGKLMLENGAVTTTPQNSYLTFVLLFGIVNAIVFYFFYAYILLRFVFIESLDNVTKAVFCLFVFLSLDGVVRSYIIGGVGLLPLLLATSFAYLLRKL